MKTAMNELIDWISEPTEKRTALEIVKKALELEKVEKQQIIDARDDGMDDYKNGCVKSHTEYYNETFNQ